MPPPPKNKHKKQYNTSHTPSNNNPNRLPLTLKTIFASILIILIMIVLSLPLFTHYLIITKLLKRKLKKLTPYDSIFAVDEFHTHSHASNLTLIQFTGTLSLEKLKEEFKKRIIEVSGFEKLKKIIVNYYGYYFWEDCCSTTDSVSSSDVFDLNEHFTKGDFNGEDELYSFLSDFIVKPYGGNRPLWEVALLEKKNSNGGGSGGGVVVIKIHHCYADGYSQNYIVDKLLGVESECLVKNKVEKSGRGFLWGLKTLLTAPRKLALLYLDALTTPPNHYTKRKVSKTGLISTTTFSLSKFKQIRRLTQSHFATIGMSLMTGAIRRHHIKNEIKILPNNLSIMHSLPKINHPQNKLTNHWGVGLFKIPFEEENCLKRLNLSENYYNFYIDNEFDELLHLNMPMLGWFTGGMLKFFFNINFGTSCGFTSVPAYQKEGKLFGEIGVDGLGKVFGFQWGQTAIATALYTHNGSVQFTMYANRDIVKDQSEMNALVKIELREEFEELHREVISKFGRGLESFA